MSFAWNDPLLVDEQLTEDERQVRDSVRRFARERLEPRVVADFRTAGFDRELMADVGRLGLLGGTLDGHGCPGLGHVAWGLALREIERIDSGYRSCISVQSSLVMYPIHAFGDDAQRRRFLPGLATGEQVGAFCLTEPEHGSDPGSLACRARERADGFELSGTKTWITNAPIADLFVVWARHDDGRVGAFLVERGADGLETPPIEGKLSLCTSRTGQVVMDRVFVPADRMLRDARGLRSALACLDRARYGIAWGVLGAAEFCWLAARDYVLGRSQFGRPLAAAQLVQKKLVDMQTEIALALQACLRLGRLADDGRLLPEAVSMLKRNNCGKALEIARQARDLHGANGVADDYHVMRHMVNLEGVNTYEGTHDIHALILGRAQTGIAAFG